MSARYWVGPGATVRTEGRVIVTVEGGTRQENALAAREMVRELTRRTRLLDALEHWAPLTLVIEGGRTA